MLSSTSSFRIGFATTAMLFLTYSFFLRYVGTVTTSQSQFQDNKVRLENFVFSPQTCNSAIVGSSLAFRLQLEDLGKNFCNLSFAGSSALMGLEVIHHHPVPTIRDLFVEINVLRDVDQELQKSYSNLTYTLKRFFPIFQNRYQPMTLTMNYLRRRFPPTPPAPTESQFQFWLKVQQESYGEASPSFRNGFDAYTNQLKESIAQIEAMGIRVHLVEIPMHPSVMQSTKNSYQRNRISQVFPYKKIFTDSGDYLTDDGLHLNFASAAKFAAFLRESKP